MWPDARFHLLLFSCLTSLCLGTGGSAAWGQLVIADFEGPEPLKGMTTTSGVTINVATQGVTSGEQALQITRIPVSQCADQEVYAFINFPVPLDGSDYSRISFDVTNPGNADRALGFGCVMFNTGANAGWGWDGKEWSIPAGTTETVSFDLNKMARHVRPMIDVSAVLKMGLSVSPHANEELVVHVDNVRMELDSTLGSPTLRLMSQAMELREGCIALLDNVNWDGIAPDKQEGLRQLCTKTLKKIDDTLDACRKAEQDGGFKGAYHATNKAFHDLRQENAMGRLVLLDKPVFYAWEISPYVNIFKKEFPAADSQPLSKIAVSMAVNEYRDAVFMVSGNGSGDQQIDVSLTTQDKTLQDSTLIQESLYLTNAVGQVVGGGHYRLETALAIPQSESRQIRIRFTSKNGGLKPGRYDFAIKLIDSKTSYQQVIPGTVEVWNFDLPDAASFMSNNTYPQLTQTSLADLKDLMVKDMKEYGLNVFLVHPKDISIIQPDGQVQFEFAELDKYLATVMTSWGSGPTPQFIFSLGYGIKPSEARLPTWMEEFTAVLEKHGVSFSECYFVFCDEATEQQLTMQEVPVHEEMKRAVPHARISTNSSAILSDVAVRARHFATVDRWEPDLYHVKHNPRLLDYLRSSGKPITLYQCRGTWSVRDANMYNYYRVYGWEAIQAGCVGMGLWTYCVDWNMDPWKDKENQFVLVFRHPTKRDLVHSRRYEVFREGIDDYRYVYKLRQAAQEKGAQAQARAADMIRRAVAEITSDVADTSLCEKWRLKIARAIIQLQ